MKSRLFKALVGLAIVVMLAMPVNAESDPDGVSVLGSPAGADIYIVLLEGASLASYRGGVPGLEATNPSARGETKLDAKSLASVAYLDYLANQHAKFIATMEQVLGRPVEVVFRYDVVLNGMAVRLTGQEAAVVAGLPGVRQVERESIHQIETDVGPAWIGAEGIWDGSATGEESMGEGIIVGMIDTGINGDHPSFADPGPDDGYDHENPLGEYVGDCAPPTPTYTCNDKLIGAYDFTTAGDPEDFDGHGSHTSSTAAGNVLTDVVIDFPTITIIRSISGVAPHANIISYRGCDAGGCPTSATNAAINQAVADGVDVINYSIGGGPANPWTDANALAYLDALEAGVFVATSAGNNGPDPGTVGSPGNAPWLLTVASASHSRTFTNTISFSGGDYDLGPFTGTSVTSGYGPRWIVHAGDEGDPLCGTPFPPGTWAGEIVVCDRGQYALVDKVANVAAGGAAAAVIANADFNGLQTYAIPHVLPSTHLNYADSEALRVWLASGSGHQANITDAVVSVDDAQGDRLAVYSSRGPNAPVPGVIKPDVMAPGVDILAAYKTPEEYNMIGGTSMASPHAAGAAILLRSLHPDWTVAEIHSALVSTAIPDFALKEDWVTPADPFDMGGGRVYASNAARAGIVLDETRASFEAASPMLGGDPSALNLATLSQAACEGSCSWTRSVASTLDTTESWTVSVETAPGMDLTVTPDSFDLASGASQTIEVVADVSGLPHGEWVFGQVILTPASAEVSEAHLPVAAAPWAPPEISVEPAEFEPYPLPGTVLTEPLTIGNTGADPLDWEIWEDAGQPGRAPKLLDWFDDFDSYETGSQMHGQGGWKGWFNDPTYGAIVTDAYSLSPPNSVEIIGPSDLVREYTDYDTDFWRYTAWQYVPEDFEGESYFILLNQYNDSGAGLNWSTQVHFNADLDLVLADGVGAGTALPLVRGEWVELRVEIDLINDSQEFYYDGQLLYDGSWKDGMSGGGILNIGAVDLFANGASAVFYDDLSLVEVPPEVCDLINEIPWVSASPDSGTTDPGESSGVDIVFDSGGLPFGTYISTLCVGSNDPVNPVVPVPLTMTVTSAQVVLAPAEQNAFGAPGEAVTYTYMLTNTGVAPDTYALAVSGNDWDTSVADTTGELNPDESIELEVVVTIPADPATMAVPIGSDTFTLMAVSGVEPAVTAQASGTTVAEATPGVSLGDDQAGTGFLGTQVVYTFAVTNLGNYTDTVALTLSGETWPSTLSVDMTEALGPGESQDITLTVEIPMGIADGDVDMVTLTATSELDPGESVSAAATTTGEWHRIYLPLIRRND